MCGRKASFSVRPFEKLKKTIESKTAVPAPARQKKKEDYTDEELFDREMDDVAEIESFRALSCDHAPRKADARPVRRDPDAETLAILGEIAAGQRPIHLPDTQEYVEWAHPDYHDTIIPKLHEGHFSIQAFLDLHGCTVAEAEQELESFVQESFQKGLRCVKIIHGRGLRSVKGARIKQAIVKRLSGHFRRDVIAFVTARQCDGGLGALYVLLKKKRARP
jgi:DNA-nicking Smr family endonuclease